MYIAEEEHLIPIKTPSETTLPLLLSFDLLVLLDTNVGSLEFPRGNPSLEHDINFSVGPCRQRLARSCQKANLPVLVFWKTEVRNNKGEKSGTTPNETTFTADYILA